MPQEMTKKEYNYSIDVTKFIMAILVIAIHTRPVIDSGDVIKNIFDTVVDLAVPFFFLVSGYFYGKKDRDGKAILLGFIKMYVIWCLIYAPLSVFYFIENKVSVIKAASLYIRSFLFTGDIYNGYHLWYLLSAVYGMLFLLLLQKIRVSKKLMPIIIFLALACSIFLTALGLINGELTGALAVLKKVVDYTVSDGRVLKGLIYIPLGYYLSKITVDGKWFGIIFAAALLLRFATINIFIFSEFFLVFAAAGLFGFVKEINVKKNTLTASFRKVSTLMYFIHMYIYFFVSYAMYGKMHMGVDVFLITLIITIIVSYLANIKEILHKC